MVILAIVWSHYIISLDFVHGLDSVLEVRGFLLYCYILRCPLFIDHLEVVPHVWTPHKLRNLVMFHPPSAQVHIDDGSVGKTGEGEEEKEDGAGARDDDNDPDQRKAAVAPLEFIAGNHIYCIQ